MKLIGKNTQAVADRIIEAFREPDQLPKALAPAFIHRKSDSPCRRWSFYNQLLVALAQTGDARGFKQWKEAGRKVKKGSKALWILGPCLKTIKDKDCAGDEKAKQILFGFRSIPVFRVEDTEGEALPEDEYADWIKQLPLIEVAESWNIHVDTVSHRDGDPLGYYQYGSASQAIVLSTENAATWLHELTHAADHRIGGLKEAKWHKEVVAELGAAVLAQCLGLERESDLGGAYEYVKSYSSRAGIAPVRACIDVLNRVCSCVTLILDEAERVQTLPPVPAA